MPLDMTTEKGQKWWVARGRFNDNDLVHCFRYYRYRNGYSLSDISKQINISVNVLIKFERREWHPALDLRVINKLLEDGS